MSRPATGGFTLLELMLSMTIMAVVIVLVLGAFQLGVRAWEKGERDIGSSERQRVVLDLMKRQIASMWVRVPPPSLNEDEQVLLFKGDERSMSFISHKALAPGHKFGMVYVRYDVLRDGEGGTGIRLFEENTVFMGPYADLGRIKDKDTVWLLEGAEAVRFAYLTPETDGSPGEWVDAWDALEYRGYPKAVGISFQRAEDETVIEVVAPILPEVFFD